MATTWPDGVEKHVDVSWPLGPTQHADIVWPLGAQQHADAGWPLGAQQHADVVWPFSASGAAPVAPVLSDVTLSAALGSVGDTLTATPVYSTPGTAPVVPTYQWTRGGSDIPGATSSTYTLVGADEGAAIRCRCSATGPGGSTGPVTSSGLCQVRVYGFARSALNDDSITTVGLVGLPSAITLLYLGDVSAVGATRGHLLGYGRQSGAAARGAALQTTGATLEMVVANIASNNSVATKPLPGTPVSLGEVLYWGRSDGVTVSAGFGDPAVNAPGTSSIAGHQSTASFPAGLYARPSDVSIFQSAGRAVLAVVGRIVSDAELTALHTSPNGVRAALIDMLKAESLLLWWPVPLASTIASGPDVGDLAGIHTHALTTGTSRITAEGP